MPPWPRQPPAARGTIDRCGVRPDALAAGCARLRRRPRPRPLASSRRPVALGADGIAIRTAARYVVARRSAGPGHGRRHGDQPEAQQGHAAAPSRATTTTASTSASSPRRATCARRRTGRPVAGRRSSRRAATGSSPCGSAARIFFGEQATVRLQFDLPAGKPRSDSDVRVGPAFASFLAWSFGDAGRSGSTCPRRSTSTSRARAPGSRRPTAASRCYRARPTTPSSWFAWVNARNDDGAHAASSSTWRTATVVVVRAWPEDRAGGAGSAASSSDGIPELDPADRPAVAGRRLAERARDPHAAARGVRRLLRPANDEITISEDLDDVTIVHEASHAWFNQQPVQRALDHRGPGRDVRGGGRRRDRRGRGRAAAGSHPDAASPSRSTTGPARRRSRMTTASAREQFGYDAACEVMAEIVTAPATRGCSALFAAADAGTTAYPGEAPPEPRR